MNYQMNFETFISMFDTETDAINHILLASDDGRVETTQHTLPYYTLVSPSKPQTDTGSEYDRLAQPPRFIAYSDYAPQIHHYEVRINASKGSDNDIVIEFPMGDTKAIDWFSNHLFQRLSDGWGDIESHEMNITNPYDIECSALALQRERNFQRIYETQRAVTGNEYVTIEQFEQNCRDVVTMLDENKAITERIQYINDVQHISQLA